MAFRINKGIFQFSDGTKFINKFKIDDNSGELVEVDPETGDPVDGYLRTSGKAADANLLDGINSSAFLRSNAADTASARIDFTADESIRFKGARGQFTNEYIHLYNKVGIGHPSGWGQGQTDTPDKGISTYGGANFAYGNNAQSSFKGSLRVDANWGANDYAEAFTIRGTYPSIALRSTTHNAKWLIHNDNNVSWYYGSAVDTADWGLKFRIATNGNIWMSWAGGWLSDLLNAKEDSGVAQVAIDAAKEELLNGAISTAQTTADNAATAAATATNNANTALERADGTKLAVAELGDSLGTAAYAATGDFLGATAKAADSNLLDGVDSSRFVFGGNATKTTNVSNFTTALSSGFYDAYNTTGTPTGTWYTMINMRHNNTGNNYGSQIAVSFYSNADMFVRTISNGSYQGWSRIWNEANFDPSTKLGVTAKAADSDKLDGYDWGQSGKNVRATEFYADNWFRNYNSNEGLYNQATGQHWYSDDDDYWNIAGGTAANGIRFRDEHAGTIRGYVYATNSNEIGFLDSDGSWAVRVVRDSHVELRDNNEVVFTAGQGGHSSNYGTVCTHGNGRGGWEGYSINGWWVFMSSDGSNSGIYNDVDNEWMTRWYRNGGTELMHNGSTKLTTTGSGVSVTGTVSATAFSGDGSGLTNIPIPAPSIPAFIFGMEDTEITSVEVTDRGEIRFNLANGQALYLDGIRPSIR